MDNFDYPTAASVWQRVNPQETPYPEAERGRFEMISGAQPTQPMRPTQSMPSTPTQPMRPTPMPTPGPMPLPTPMLPQNGAEGGQQMYRALLREEMRHLQQVISVLEKALA